ncbi:hypothetical protein BS17DRAFT_60357 [Gyrodon lividus]|nr:hypothetical protein BS17DRAFT_60357 [Gyrodon lividus]
MIFWVTYKHNNNMPPLRPSLSLSLSLSLSPSPALVAACCQPTHPSTLVQMIDCQ